MGSVRPRVAGVVVVSFQQSRFAASLELVDAGDRLRPAVLQQWVEPSNCNEQKESKESKDSATARRTQKVRRWGWGGAAVGMVAHAPPRW